MNRNVDSKSLFVTQVRGHSETLCDLLACDTTAPAPESVRERCAVSTHMLAGTSSLMGYQAWSRLLEAYNSLLACYRDRGLHWDERVAEVTSELIEKEEQLTAACKSDAAADLGEAVKPDELDALHQGLVALMESLPEAPPAPVRQTTAELQGRPLAGILSGLRESIEEAQAGFETGPFVAGDWTSPEIATVRRQLHFVDFYCRAIEQIIDAMTSGGQMHRCSLTPVRVALEDFARELGSGERELEVTFDGEVTETDPRLLLTAGAILQRMITDVFHRSDAPGLRVTIGVQQENGALRWRVSDTGDNFISDSRLDHEDQLAFYPGLKDVRKMLARLHSALWVEPHDGRETRFEFTMPVSRSPESYVVWGEGQNTFGVRSEQVCDLLPCGTDARHEDSFGEYLQIDNRRVPLLKLDVLFREAPSDGAVIAVIGSLEKRISFYVPDQGTLNQGRTMEGSIPVWRGLAHDVAEVGERRIALVDADQILEGYLDLTGEMRSEDVSGGVLDDESEVSNGQAPSVSDVQAPPDLSSQEEGGVVEVLVVEQSQALRTALGEILSAGRLNAAFAGEVDEAMNLIQLRSPRVIISEFRMPSMAAKVLVDSMKSQGKSIPVLVTTSQSGKTADLLVEKLGAAGYLSKPLNKEEVTTRINKFLSERTHAG